MRYACDMMMAVFTIMLRSFLIKSLWLWFIVPQFFVQPLKLSTSIGIVLMVGGVTALKTASKSELDEMKGYDDKARLVVTLTNFLAQAMDIVLIYVFAWLIHCMM